MKSEMALIAVVVLVLGSAAVEGKHAPAPAPAVDCSTLVTGNLIDCLNFVTNGSTDKTPTKTCCAGLKTVLSTDAQCLCDTFKSSGSLGLPLNITKALTLPAACHVSAPSIENCAATVSPAGAPASSPAGAPGSSEANAPGSGGASAPSPTAGKNASPAVGVSLSSVVLCLVGAIFYSL